MKYLHKNIIFLLKLSWVIFILFFLWIYYEKLAINNKVNEIDINWAIIFIALSMEVLRRIIGGTRWLCIVKFNSNKNLSSFQLFKDFFISNLSSYIPGGLAFYLTRIVYSKERGQGVTEAIKNSFIELLALISSAFIVSIPLYPILSNKITITLSILILFTIFIFFVTVYFFSKKIKAIISYSKYKNIFSGNTFYRFLSALALSCLIWIISGIGLFFILLSFDGVDLELNTLLKIIPLYAFSWVLGYLSFWAPAGLGIRDGIIFVGLNQIVTSDISFFVVIIARLLTLIADIILASIIILFEKFIMPKNHN